MNEQYRSTVLITGASSGIGRAFANAFAKRGDRLLLVGRSEAAMRELLAETSAEGTVIRADLSDPAEVDRLIENLENEPVDLFINNAGIGAAGCFGEVPEEQEMRMLSINCAAMHRLFRAVLSSMEERGGGRIVNVASSAGLLPGGPYMAAYYASKAYVVHLTRAVAVELKEKNSPVIVQVLCPGPVDSNFNRASGIKRGLPGIAPEVCVREALRGMRGRRVVLVPTLRMRLAMFGSRLLPESLLLRMTAHQQKKKL